MNSIKLCTNDSAEYQEYAQRLWWINQINLWFQVVIIPLGLVGNSLCLLVMNQKQNRSISCSVYMSALAVTDCLVLIVNGMNLFLAHGVVGLCRKRARLMCRVIDYLFHTSIHTGMMIILSLLLERVIVVMKPLKAASLLSSKRALIVICVMTILTTSYNIPRIFFTSARVTPQGMKCNEFAGANAAHFPYIVANLFIPSFMPLAAILIMNILIIVAIKSDKYLIYLRDDSSRSGTALSGTKKTATGTSKANKQEDMTERADGQLTKIATGANTVSVISTTNNQEERRKRWERQLTIMTIVMTTAFMICILPSFIHDPVFSNSFPHVPCRTPQLRLAFPWSEMITQNLLAFNSAINFFVYVVSGSKFRKDLMNLCQRKSE